MLKKTNRLNEKQIKKVLSKAKPFFSYSIVSNALNNGLNYNRFAIIIGAKSVKNNITRNYFRRVFYDLLNDKINSTKGNDIVFVVKKQLKLDKDDEKIVADFKKDVNFLIYKNNL